MVYKRNVSSGTGRILFDLFNSRKSSISRGEKGNLPGFFLSPFAPVRLIHLRVHLPT